MISAVVLNQTLIIALVVSQLLLLAMVLKLRKRVSKLERDKA